MTAKDADMRPYTYVVEHDFGFAPNPFYRICTLATCKPEIRRTAGVNDYVVGFGGSDNGLSGRLVYFMKVSEVTDFDSYWNDSRFWAKRPTLRGSRMQAFGDNIYHRDRRTGHWRQENSYHSLATGIHAGNLARDTGKTDRVLIGTHYAYFGGSGPKVPDRFRYSNGTDICRGRPNRCRFEPEFVSAMVEWLEGLGVQGWCGRPANWPRS